MGIIFTFIAVLLAALALNLFANRVIFRPMKKEWPLTLPWEKVFIPTRGGKKLHALYLPAQRERNSFVLPRESRKCDLF